MLGRVKLKSEAVEKQINKLIDQRTSKAKGCKVK